MWLLIPFRDGDGDYGSAYDHDGGGNDDDVGDDDGGDDDGGRGVGDENADYHSGDGVTMVVEAVVMLHTYGHLRRYLYLRRYEISRRYLFLRANQEHP